MTAQAPTWQDFGPAEFGRRRCPKDAKQAPAGQGGLFVMAREPLPTGSPAPPPELDGQAGLFGEDAP